MERMQTTQVETGQFLEDASFGDIASKGKHSEETLDEATPSMIGGQVLMPMLDMMVYPGGVFADLCRGK